MFRDQIQADGDSYLPIGQLLPLVSSPAGLVCAVIHGYCDGSNSDGLIGLGAYVAPTVFWGQFEAAWPTVLAGRVPGVHMKDLYRRTDPRAFAGVSQDVATAVVDDCVTYLSGLSMFAFRRYSCVVRLADFEAAQKQAPGLAGKTAQDICVDACTGRIFRPHLQEPGDPERNIVLFFDGNEPFRHRINRVFERERNRRENGWSPFVRSIGAVDNSDNSVLPLQACDVLAWVARRYRANNDHKPWHDALCGGSPRQFNYHDFFDYDALMAKYGEP